MEPLQEQPWVWATLLTFLLGGLRFIWLERGAYFPYLRQFFLTSFHVESEDTRFQKYLSWFRETFKDSRCLKAGEDLELSETVPDLGIYFTWFHGRPLFVDYAKIQSEGQKTVTSLTFFFPGQQSRLIKALHMGAEKAYRKQKGDQTEVWVNLWGVWELLGRRPRRPAETLFFKDNAHLNIREDLLKFLDKKEIYARRGTPWQRGYLLHGPPGNGKTSLVFWLANEIGYNIAILNPSQVHDDAFLQLMTEIPKDSLIVLEDVDVLIQSGKRKKKAIRTGHDGPKLSTVLNSLDGAFSKPGQIIFMTTNRKQFLDPALIRAGRADVHLEIGPPEENQIRKMFGFYYPEEDPQEFLQQALPLKPSMADLQVHFNRFTAQEALEKISELVMDRKGSEKDPA